jgi:hypothetical protein
MEPTARAASNHRSADRLRALWLAGSSASVLSTAALMVLGVRAAGRPAAGINGPSQWLWGRAEKYRTHINWRNTATGYLIHHACSVLWAALFAGTQIRRWVPHPLARAAAVTTLAAAVDYCVVPRRFTPGFEARLPRSSIGIVYIVFGAGLVLGERLAAWRAARTQRRPRRDLAQAHSARERARAGSFLAAIQRR